MINILQAETPSQIEDVRKLFREDELRNLPGRYAKPDGRLLLATIDEKPAGWAALRKLDEGICEMKRLYIRKDFRGGGLGNTIIEKLIDEAHVIGYKKMRLDTYPLKMEKAVKLYEFHGFTAIPPYYDNSDEGVLFMEMDLQLHFA